MTLIGLRRAQSLSRDSRRIADLQQIRNALEVYFARYQQFPNFTNSSWTTQTDPFPAALIGAGLDIRSVPVDPLNRAPYVYTYSVDTTALTRYVLRAILENSGNPALRDDIDGTVYGVDCGTGATEVNYCTGG
jgi:type II secretory pathway pseudopilin PulG